MRWCGFWTCLRIQKSRYQREREREMEKRRYVRYVERMKRKE